MGRLYAILSIGMCLIMTNCKPENKANMQNATEFNQSPNWAESAIWYQIFIERFANGNLKNEPSIKYMQAGLDDEIPKDWKVQDWKSNWFERAAWEENSAFPFYTTVQMRRYGGDLQGVLDKIPYLKDLGINAVYFNPINDAPSLHKYDARSYHHVDINFGNDPDGDWQLMQKENPADPKSWVWTSADKLFLEVVNKLHANGIKVIVDFSFNHTGRSFWAFQDLIKNQAKSLYKDWYEVKSFDNPESTEDELDYEGWFGIKHLPELKKIRLSPKIEGEPFEGNIVAPVKEHLFAVCKRWMDPNGDGSTTDGIDGMRFDVAEHVPIGFWKDLRKYLRSINSEFFMVGECWWKEFPDHLMDPKPWVDGDIFDAVMHYHWYKPARAFFRRSDDSLNLEEYCAQTADLWQGYRVNTGRSMMNLNASHDSPRFWTSISNKNKYKYQARTYDNPMYYTGKPDDLSLAIGKALLLHQFTFIGSPHIWNGDEMGMWGADDPDNRKPLWWPEIDFEKETQPPFADYQYNIKPSFDQSLYEYYKKLIALRKSNVLFSKGSIDFAGEYVSQGILAYRRTIESDSILVLINAGQTEISIDLDGKDKGAGELFTLGHVNRDGDKIEFGIYSGIVLKNQ